MALDTYTSLTTAVASNWMHRSDLGTVVGDFVDLFEAEFNADMRVRQMENSTSVSSTAGYLVHPAQWREWKQLTLNSGGNKFVLQPISEESAIHMTGREGTGTPRYYKTRGDKTYLYPTPSTNVVVETVYWEGVTALSTAHPSNWVLASYPGAYLFGSLSEAAPYVVDDPRVPLWKQRLAETLNRIKVESERAERSGQVMRIRPDVSVK